MSTSKGATSHPPDSLTERMNHRLLFPMTLSFFDGIPVCQLRRLRQLGRCLSCFWQTALQRPCPEREQEMLWWLGLVSTWPAGSHSPLFSALLLKECFMLSTFGENRLCPFSFSHLNVCVANLHSPHSLRITIRLRKHLAASEIRRLCLLSPRLCLPLCR